MVGDSAEARALCEHHVPKPYWKRHRNRAQRQSVSTAFCTPAEHPGIAQIAFLQMQESLSAATDTLSFAAGNFCAPNAVAGPREQSSGTADISFATEG